MAAAIPVLGGVPYGVASRITYYVGGRQSHSVHPGTPEAESLFEDFTGQIAQSVNNMTVPYLVEFVLSQGDKILHFLVGGEERDRGEEMTQTILNDDSSSTTSPTNAGDAARWLVTMHKSKQLLQVAATIAGHRNAATVEEADVDDALYWLRLRATSAPHALGALEGEFEQDGEWLPPPEEVEDEEIRAEEELDQAEDAALESAVQASSEEGEEEEEEGSGGRETDEEGEGDIGEQGGEETSEGPTEEMAAQEASAAEVEATSAQGPETACVGAGGSSSERGTKRKGGARGVPRAGSRAPLSSLVNADSDGKKKARRQ